MSSHFALTPGPATAANWRTRFIDLVEALYRELGHPLPAMTHDDDAPLGVELEIDGLVCQVSHLPQERPDQLAVACIVPLPNDRLRLEVLSSLLAANRELTRIGGSLSVDPDSGLLVLGMRRRIDQMQALDVLGLAVELAARAQAWQREETTAGDDDPWCACHSATSGAAPTMSAATFMEQVRRYCGSDVAAGADVLKTEIVLDGTNFTLRSDDQGEPGEPGFVHLECRFGPLPQDAAPAQDAALRLLHLNRALLELDSCAAFALDQVTGEATFWQSFALRDTQPSALVGAMRRLAAQSAAWRLNHDFTAPLARALKPLCAVALA